MKVKCAIIFSLVLTTTSFADYSIMIEKAWPGGLCQIYPDKVTIIANHYDPNNEFAEEEGEYATDAFIEHVFNFNKREDIRKNLELASSQEVTDVYEGFIPYNIRITGFHNSQPFELMTMGGSGDVLDSNGIRRNLSKQARILINLVNTFCPTQIEEFAYLSKHDSSMFSERTTF